MGTRRAADKVSLGRIHPSGHLRGARHEMVVENTAPANPNWYQLNKLENSAAHVHTAPKWCLSKWLESGRILQKRLGLTSS